MAENAFTKVQYGLESTHGNAVAATARWPGVVKVPSDRKPVYPKETLGIRARAHRSAIYQTHVDGLMLSMEDAVFQKLPFLFSIGLRGEVSAAEQTTDQGDYLWDFTPSLTETNVLNSATLEYGDDTQAYEIEYLMAKRLSISGAMGQNAAVKVEVECFGRQIKPTTFTSSLGLSDGTPMVANMAKFYVDGTWANLGNTEKPGLLREYSIEILTGLHAKFSGAGTKYFYNHGESYPDLMATFTFEGNSDADALFDAYQAQTPSALRLQLLGPQIGSGDSHCLQLNMYGSFEEIIPLGSEQDGNNLHTAVFHAYSDDQSTPHSFAALVTTDSDAV